MKKLYPLKFQPITQYRIWGGNTLNPYVSAEFQMDNLGEIWSISGVEGNVSKVSNGELKGKSLNEILKMHQQDLVGKQAWRQFGEGFPLLIKFINSAQPLSVQVHPGDKQAKEKHNSFGKSEMWYIMDAEKDSNLIIGFESGTTKEDYLQHLENETLENILHQVSVEKGDALYIPAGRVHAIGAGVTLAEIQQTSDITYRIYDYNRIDKNGKQRELHTDLALEAIDFNPIENIKTEYDSSENQFNPLIDSPYFKTKIYNGTQAISIQGNQEMRIYICTEGKANVLTENYKVELKAYESILIPAGISDFEIQVEKQSSLIEVGL